MGLISFISKGRKVVFQARARTKARPTKTKSPKRRSISPRELSRIGQAEQAIRNAKKAGIPFSKRQERELRETAVTGSRSRSRSRSRRSISNNSADMNV